MIKGVEGDGLNMLNLTDQEAEDEKEHEDDRFHPVLLCRSKEAAVI